MQPQTQRDNYDFILQNPSTPKRNLLSGVKPIYLIAGVLIVLMLLVIVFGAVLGNSSKGNRALIEPLGKAGEIVRINTLERSKLKDSNVISLAATANEAVLSDQTQITKYLSSHKTRVNKKSLASYQNKTVDSQLAAAESNNSLDQAYILYLKKALSDYAQSLKSAYPSVKSSQGKAIIQSAYQSTQTLLSSAQLK